MKPLRFAFLVSIAMHIGVLLGLPGELPSPRSSADGGPTFEIALLAAPSPRPEEPTRPEEAMPSPSSETPAGERRQAADQRNRPVEMPPVTRNRLARETVALPVPSSPSASPPPQTEVAETPQDERPMPASAVAATQSETDSAIRIEAELAYKRELQAAIASNKRYPRLARRLGQEGTVEVAFVILSDGELRDVRVARGSGFTPLDRAAVDTLRRLGRFQPIPPELDRDHWDLVVPLSYELL